MRSSRNVWPVLVVALVGVLIGGGGWALAASTNARPVNAQIVANFAQFRRPRTPADVLPAGVPSARGCSGPFEQGGAKEAPLTGLEAWYQIQCFRGSGPPAGTSRGRVITGLQRDQSRAVPLPDRLGTIWLIPSGRWLCNLFRSRFLLGPGRSRFLLGPGEYAMACEPISVVLAHPPLWNGGGWSAPSGRFTGSYLFALEPDWVTKVTLGYYHDGKVRTYLANNVLGACVSGGLEEWLEQTGPTMSAPIKTFLSGERHGRFRKCPRHLP